VAARTLWVSGLACYLAWQTGTLIGLLGAGAGLAGVEALASAVFPVLFIGLATLTATARSHAARALGAAALTAGWAFALPDLRALAPVVTSVVVALPRGEPPQAAGRPDQLQRSQGSPVSPWVLVAIAAITYSSRAVALVLLPRPGARLEGMLARMPAPIFASLATLTLLTDGPALTGGPTLCAALGALIASPQRSLALCLIDGVTGYALGKLLR
jgi:hypothetical protein